MPRVFVFVLFFTAIFLQSGAYGLTFMLPQLFESFGANEKAVGTMLLITAVATLITVYFSGHLSDIFGRVRVLGIACMFIAVALFLYGSAGDVGLKLMVASILLGCGWGLTYSLAPVVMTRLVHSEERVRYFALLSVFIMAGFGLSPVLAAFVQKSGFTVNDAFYITAVLCLISALIFFILITPVQSHSLLNGTETASRLTLRTTVQIMKSRALLPVIMVCLGASVFAGMNNFQTVFAKNRGLNYADYFLTYTITVMVFRVLLARSKGGKSPYLSIAVLQYIMGGSILLFLFMGNSALLYIAVAILFGIGYGVSYPILAAMASHDANKDLVPQTLQLFAFAYFIGIFGFPLIAGWLIVEFSTSVLLWIIIALALIEASMAARRAFQLRSAKLMSDGHVTRDQSLKRQLGE